MFIVTGHFRSGTSMVMQALTAGGINPIHRNGEPKKFNITDDYHPNPNGYYQMYPKDIDRISKFIHLVPERIMKIHTPWWEYMPLGNYTVIYIVRDPAEVAMSLQKCTGTKYSALDFNIDHNAATMDILNKGGNVIRLDYRDVVESPLRHMRFLSKYGWPIDVIAAAKAINPSLYRHRV